MKSIFETKEQYLEFIKNWKLACNTEGSDKLELQHFILYRMLKGKNWRACLSESSREDTIANARYWAESCDPKYLSLWPFVGITSDMILKARENMENK